MTFVVSTILQDLSITSKPGPQKLLFSKLFWIFWTSDWLIQPANQKTLFGKYLTFRKDLVNIVLDKIILRDLSEDMSALLFFNPALLCENIHTYCDRKQVDIWTSVTRFSMSWNLIDLSWSLVVGLILLTPKLRSPAGK